MIVIAPRKKTGVEPVPATKVDETINEPSDKPKRAAKSRKTDK